MKRKLLFVLAFAFALLLTFGMTASAFSPYQTYTYSSAGVGMRSPDAYTASEGSVHTDDTMSKNASVSVEFSATDDADAAQLADICTDPRGWVYLSDKKNNRVLVLNQNFKLQYIIETFISDKVGRGDSLKNPQGLFATEEYLFVCDADNQRIVRFDLSDPLEGVAMSIVAPESKAFPETFTFTPIACAYDRFGKLFVVSQGASEGVIVMDENSVFSGFIGAQKVTVSAFDQFFDRFGGDDEEDEDSTDLKNYASPLRNITLEHGTYGDFLYIVSDNINHKTEQEAAILSKEPDFSPIRKINSKGDEIMKRNGFFDCGGEVNISAYDSKSIRGVSVIYDVAVGPAKAGTWSIIDNMRSKVYTYDQQGQLLFVFGDMTGSQNQMGNIAQNGLAAIEYQYDRANDTYNIILLDSVNLTLTCYSCTEYGELLLSALENDNNRNYSQSIEYWKDILEANNNFDTAYIGVGKALYNSGRYEEALEYLEAAKETTVYAQTLKAQSQERITSNIWIPIGIVVLCVLLIVAAVKILGYAKRVNYRGNFKKKHTYWEELIYAFYVVFHPFDGFWDIKHENRGTLRGGLTILGINAVAFYYQTIGRSYLANPTGAYSSFFTQVAAITLPVILWSVANWCLTTLFDGEAKFKHVFVSACYATAPLPIFVVAGTIITNLSNTVGDNIVTLVTAIGYVWVAFLLFFGTLVVQDYSLGKNVVTTVGTILTMAVIMFVVILFASLVGDIVGFVSSLATEIGYRT